MQLYPAWQEPIQVREDHYPQDTAVFLVEQARTGVFDRRVLDVARIIVLGVSESFDYPEASQLSVLWAVWGFLMSRFRYTDDPRDVEVVYGPPAIAERILSYGRWAGDCDDFVAILASLLKSLGFDVYVTLITYTGEFFESHVVVQVKSPQFGWLTLDPSMKSRAPEALKETGRIQPFQV